MAFEQVFKNIDNALRTDEGCSSELDYVEQARGTFYNFQRSLYQQAI